MKGFLLDTNVISELRKGRRCNRGVQDWFEALPQNEIFLSVLTLGEIRKGIGRIRQRDPAQGIILEKWRAELETAFARSGRLLMIDAAVAQEWGDLQIGRPLPTVDGLLAATAILNDLTLSTRNLGDFAHLPVAVMNPFS